MAINKKSPRISSHPILSRVWAYDLNKGLDPANIGHKSNKSYFWICSECGKPYKAWPHTAIDREGRCRECYKPIKIAKRNAAIIKKHGSIADVQEVMEIWHEDNTLDPKQTCKSSEYRALFHCKDCGETFEREVKNVKLGQYYCLDCAEKRRRNTYKQTRINNHDTCEVYPEIMAIWDWERNKKRPEEVPAGSDQDVHFICPKCNKRWIGHPYSRKGKHPCCGNCGRSIGARKNAQVHIKKFGSFGDKYPQYVSWWHPTKNGTATPYNIAPNDKELRYFRCDRGHTFTAKPQNLGAKRGGCPKCRPSIHSSFMGKAVYFYLKQLTKAQSEKRIKDSMFTMDVYLPELKTCIEYDGVNFHQGKMAMNRDLRKNDLLEERGIRIIRIMEWQSDHHNVSTIFYDYKKGDFQSCMNTLCDMLSLPHIDVNMERDTPAIYKLLHPDVLENSITKVAPQIVRYWDKKANGGISTDKVAANSHLLFHWRCPDCGDTWVTNPANEKRIVYPCTNCGWETRRQNLRKVAIIANEKRKQKRLKKEGSE